ncbi:MAG TPA: alpha/beta hydrolase-fold protein [Clostridia bacterium]|nr:alpha/beta hydrolase-fold protein [Clostridia bacterium]
MRTIQRVVLALLLLTITTPAFAAVRGKLERFPLQSKQFATTYDVHVYLPPAYDPAKRYPVIYCTYDGVYFERVPMVEAYERALGGGAKEAVIIGIPDTPGYEGMPGFPEADKYRTMVVEELVPAVESRYSVAKDRAGRRLLGFSHGGVKLLNVVAAHPAVFSRIAMQSPGWLVWDKEYKKIEREIFDEAAAELRSAGSALPTVWMTWGDGSTEWESRSRKQGDRMAAILRGKDAEVTLGKLVKGDHGLDLATQSFDEAFAFLLKD